MIAAVPLPQAPMSDVPFDATTDPSGEEQEEQLPEALVPVVELIDQQQLSSQDTLTLARVLLGGLLIDHQLVVQEFEEASADGEACINASEVVAWAADLTVLANSLDLLAGLCFEEPTEEDEPEPVVRYD